jgi:hypothetical protein
LNAGLYAEHLDEASFLYGQRLAYLHDPEVSWPDLRVGEERFEAHVDALVVGGEPALDVCRERATPGNPGEINVALRVMARQNRRGDAFKILMTIDAADESVLTAAAQALCCDAPTAWPDELLRALTMDQLPLTPLLVKVMGYRRFAFQDALGGKLPDGASVGRPELAWALGRVGGTASLPLLRSLLDGEDGRACEAAALALMRLGDERPLERAVAAVHTQAWAPRVLAIGGGSNAVRALVDVLERGRAGPDVALALGALGDLRAVAPLLDCLEDQELSEAAAVALNTITGAHLHGAVFVPADFDPDELTDDERQAYERDGTLPTRHGEPFGTWEIRPLLDKHAWRSWLEGHKHQFNRRYRWRMGRLYGPSALLECLRSPTTPFTVRSITYEELVVRYALDVPFEVDLPVRLQLKFLDKIEAWVARRMHRFEEGRWYFAGEVQN